MGDRTGSREPKLSSLKKSKKNPGAPAAKVKKLAKTVPISSQSQPPPQLKSGKYFDCGVALLSRQFDRDRDRVLTRASDEKVAGIVCWCSDIEKAQTISDQCKSNSGFAYFLTGVHPDNIERTNKKSHDVWIEKIEELARRPECIGILSGLNMTRDIGTHFAQESVLRLSITAAQKAQLPLVVHVPGSTSLDRAIEILKEEGIVEAREESGDNESTSASNRRVLLHDPVTACGLEPTKLQSAISCGLGFIVSAVGLTDADSAVREKAQACVKQLPITQVVTQTDSPWRTPQNMPDVYLRTLRNEPCNMEFVNQAVADVFGMMQELDRFSHIVKQNAIEIFGLETLLPFGNGSDLSSSLEQTHISVPQAKPDVKLNEKLPSTAISTAAPTTAPTVSNEGDDEEDDDSDEEEPESFYGCMKCRTRLFEGSFISKHALDTSKTVFKDSEEGMCQSVVFVPCVGIADLSSRTSLSVTGDVTVSSGFSAIECKGCGSKLGKFYTQEAHCACGAIIKGPIARLLTAKMDFFDLSLDQDELLQRAKHEAEDLAQFKDVDNLDAGEIEILRALQKKMKKQTSRTPRLVISSNKGNFSNFRNKTFIPNASRVAAVVTKTGKSVSVESGVTVARSGDSTHLQKQVATSVVEEGDEDDDEDNDEDDDKAVPSETKIITSTADEESDDEPVAKSVVKSRPLPPQRNTNKESMFNAFGSGSDSDEDED